MATAEYEIRTSECHLTHPPYEVGLEGGMSIALQNLFRFTVGMNPRLLTSTVCTAKGRDNLQDAEGLLYFCNLYNFEDSRFFL